MFANLPNRWKITLQVVFVLAICGMAIAILIYMGGMKPVATSHLIRFEVKASGGIAIITLQAGDASITKPTSVSMPWSQTIRIKSGTEVYLTASNPSVTGELSCSITLDKAAWKAEKISSPSNGVACAGIVP
jgi:hypothetical protein